MMVLYIYFILTIGMESFYLLLKPAELGYARVMHF